MSKQFIQKLPKTSIALSLSAMLIYARGRNWIWQPEIELISQIALAFGIWLNIYTKTK